MGVDCRVVLGHGAAGREVGCRYLVEESNDEESMWELPEQLSLEGRRQMHLTA